MHSNLASSLSLPARVSEVPMRFSSDLKKGTAETYRLPRVSGMYCPYQQRIAANCRFKPSICPLGPRAFVTDVGASM
jgi:hypothetical protein